MNELTKRYMLLARDHARTSRCRRRKIGAVLTIENIFFLGINSIIKGCDECTREKGYCPAIHAEVRVITAALHNKIDPTGATLYIWSEIPCHQCLTFLAQHFCKSIYCLTPESYIIEYDKLCKSQIEARREYSTSLGLVVIELDRNELLGGQDVLSGDTTTKRPAICDSRGSGLID